MKHTPPWPDPPGGITLADLYTPARPGRIPPATAQLEARIRAWITPHLEPLGTPERLLQTVDEALLMCAYTFPGATEEGLFLASALIVVQFLQDDLYDLDGHLSLPPLAGADLAALRTDPQLLPRTIGMLNTVLKNPGTAFVLPTGISGATCLLPAYQDLAQRIHDYGHRQHPANFRCWMQRFTTSLRRFSEGHREPDPAQGDTAAMAALTVARNGMPHTADLLELATGRFLPPDLTDHPAIRRVHHSVCILGSYLNQVISLEKEVLTEREDTNFLWWLMRHHSLSLRNASHWLTSRAQLHTDTIEDTARPQRAWTADVAEYISGMQMFADACWTWQIEGTTRYRSPSSPYAELLTLPRPATTRDGPVTVPGANRPTDQSQLLTSAPT